MAFDHDFGYSFPLFSSLLEKREEEQENELAKIVIKGHAFLLDSIKPGFMLRVQIFTLHFYFNNIIESQKSIYFTTDSNF